MVFPYFFSSTQKVIYCNQKNKEKVMKKNLSLNFSLSHNYKNIASMNTRQQPTEQTHPTSNLQPEPNLGGI